MITKSRVKKPTKIEKKAPPKKQKKPTVKPVDFEKILDVLFDKLDCDKLLKIFTSDKKEDLFEKMCQKEIEFLEKQIDRNDLSYEQILSIMDKLDKIRDYHQKYNETVIEEKPKDKDSLLFAIKAKGPLVVKEAVIFILTSPDLKKQAISAIKTVGLAIPIVLDKIKFPK